MEEILKQIENASDEEMIEILKTVIQRYGQMYPDWEVLFLSLPKTNMEERQQAIRELIEWFDNDLQPPK